MFYLEVFRALEAAGVRYLVAGGVALNLHGVPRMTADLDIALALDSENIKTALASLASLGFVPTLPVDPSGPSIDEIRRRWVREKNLVAFPLHNPSKPYETVDLLVDLPLDFDAAWASRVDMNVDGVAIHVCGIEDLVALKKHAGRPQDLADLGALARLTQRRGDPRG